MTDRPIVALLQRIQQQAAAAGRASPIADRLLGAIGPTSPAQTQTPAAALAQRAPAQSAPAASGGQGRGDPEVLALQQSLQSRGFDPGPLDGIMGPRTRAAMQAAARGEASAPMQRPGGSVPMPLPSPNPERMAGNTPTDNYTFSPNYRPSGIPAPVEPVERAELGPPWRPTAGTPDVYGPGMAVPRGTPGTRAPEEWVATPDAIGNDQPRYEGGPNLYGYQGQGGIPRIEYGLGDMAGSMGAMGKMNPAIIQQLMQGQPQQQVDPNILQQVIMQLQRAGAGV